MSKKNPLLLSINDDNKIKLSDISEINKNILTSENFEKSLILKEKDLNLFYLILKLTDNNTLEMVNFIVRNTEKKYKQMQILRKEEIRIFLIKQIFLLFKYLSLNKSRNINKLDGLYNDLYNLILKFHNSFKLTKINDIIEIIRYNIIISMHDLLDKYYIFNCSLNFLIKFYKTIINRKNVDENEMKLLNGSLIKLFECIYKNLLKNQKNLNFLQRYDNIESLALFNIVIFYRKNEKETDIGGEQDDDIQNLNNVINKIILLVYSFNYSKLINEIILNYIKEGFFELKKGNDLKIKNIIDLLSSNLYLINNLYLNEKESLENDIYFPKRYFIFNNSPSSGIDYNPEFDLFNYNFLLLFSFKVSDNTQNSPLISFISGGKGTNENEILLNISLQNKRLSLVFQNETQEFSNIEIQSDKSYLIIIEYYKGDIFEKLKLIINNNEERKLIESGLIDYDKNILVKLGYITEEIKSQNVLLEKISLRYSGIMGPVIIIPDIYNELKYNEKDEEEEEFVDNVSNLNGYYDYYLYLNNNYDLNNINLYENFRLVSSKKYKKACSYFNQLFNKYGIKNYCIISPLSIINTNENDTKIFIDNINGIKKDLEYLNIDTFYHTLRIPSKFTDATYAKINMNSLQSFIENEGIHILTLILEYYYNLLKMIINYSDYDNKLSIIYDINSALIPFFELITSIVMFFQIDIFLNDIDTLGFSLMKVVSLLGDVKTLNLNLVKSIINNIELLINFYNENISNLKISQTTLNFINKLFTMLCDPKYFDTDNFEQMKNIFRLFHEILINNYELMNYETLIAILQFSFVLDLEIDEDDDEKEFKLMKGEYKSLIELMIKQNESIPFYLEYLKVIFQKNISIKVKYKLVKIYFKSNEAVSLLYSAFNDEKFDEENRDNKDKSFWNIFKNNKKDVLKKKENILNEDNLISKYDNILTKILGMRFQYNPVNEKYHELLKCILIQLIYEQASYLTKKNPEDKYYFFSEESIAEKKKEIAKGLINSRTSVYQKSQSIKEMAKIRKSSHFPEGLKTTFSNLFGSINESEKKPPEAVVYLFDKLLETNKISFNVVKSLFCCLFDKWDRNDKFNFFKNNTDFKFEYFDSNFGNFTRNKKELISELFDFIMCITNKEEIKKSIKLIFAFLRKCIGDFKSIEEDKKMPLYNIRYYKKKFYHLFESKTLMNKLFIFCLLKNNKYITEDLREFLIVNIINICNNVMEYHPRPFIFSFIKSCLKNKDTHKNIYNIFKGISEYIINNLKKDNEHFEKEKQRCESNIDDMSIKFDNLEEKEEKENLEINSYLYYNEIRFINCLIKIFNDFQFEIQKLMIQTDYKLLNSLQNLLIAFCSSKLIYDFKIYIFHPNSLIQDSSYKSFTNYNSNSSISFLTLNSSSIEDKHKEKYEIKLLNSLDSKMLSSQILIINIIELTFLTTYILWTIPINDNNDLSTQNLLHQFMKPIFEKIFIEDHFITYYLDIFNQKNFMKLAEKENISDSLVSKFLEEIPFKYQHWTTKNPSTRDKRIFSALFYLIIIKYQSMLILYEKNQDENNNKIDLIRNIFANNIRLARNDLLSVSQIIEKIKDNKKADLIFDKEELNDKEFKNFHKNYYKYLLNYINKNKNLNIENLNYELEKKFIKDEEEKKKMKLNWINTNTNNNDSNKVNEENSNINNNNDISIKSFSEIKHIGTYNDLTDKNVGIQKKLNMSMIRKDSFNKYYKEEDEQILISANRRLTNDFHYSGMLSCSNLNFQSSNFIDACSPVLCTKRDLILKNFGYFFYDEYFKDERFIKMKNYFMSLYPASNLNNNYNGFEKQMKINYPSILKNFSNCINYYPRLFIRPDSNFFKNKYLYKSHEYLELNNPDDKKNKKEENKTNNESQIFKHIINEEENKIMHLEYSHGLLNQNNFNLFSAGNKKENFGISLGFFECEYINNRNTIQGNIKFIKNYIIFQTNKSFDFSLYETNSKYRISSRKEEINQKDKQIIIPINLIEQIIFRNFLFYNQAIEIFLYNGKSYFFNLYESFLCNDFVNALKTQYESYSINFSEQMFEIIDNPIDYFNKKKYCNLWLDGRISTLDYLLLINKFSGRSYNDLTQYLIFPWLLNNYSDINDKHNYRKMNLSMAIQDETNLENIKETYDNDKDLVKRSHFQYHYSNSSYINLYLLRLNPFTYNQIKQNGHFDAPDRQIESMQDMCIIFRDFKETSELIPEYFFMVECFLNLNFNFFGKKDSKGEEESIVNNIKLTNNFSSLLEMILFHQTFINSNEISKNVNKWIDNIFGENQITTKKSVINSYPIDCYEKFVKEDIDQKVTELNEYHSEESSEGIASKIKKLIKEIKLKTDYAYLFGQCPPQIFQKMHPIFSSIFKKNRKASMNYDEATLKNDAKINIPDKQLLYIDYKTGNNYLFILSLNEILVYTKNLRLIQTLEINKINHPYSLNIEDNHFFSKFLYKNLIFELEDCKIFFIGGYLDNSYKIYYKEKDDNDKETISLSIMTESQVTCLKKMTEKNIYFSGHKNGKIVKWNYELLIDSNKSSKKEETILNMSSIIKVNKISNIIGHKSFVQLIDINENLRIFMSSSNDGFILIRKLFDYELLNIVKYNPLKKSLLDLSFDKQIIIATFLNHQENKNERVKICTYSLNGIKLTDIKQNIILPIIVNQQTDEIVVFINCSIYNLKITFNQYTDLVLNLNENKNYDENYLDNPTKSFIDEINQNFPISMCYDNVNKIIFCLFQNGQLYKINIKN